MRSRILALLLALMLVFPLCACSVEGGSSKSETLEKSSDEYSEALYVAALTRMGKHYEFGIEIYRPDYNGDGTADWLIKYIGEYQPLWVLFEGGKLDVTPKVFFNWGAAGNMKMYVSKSNGGLYVENSYLVIAHGYMSLFQFDGEAHDYDLYMSYESLYGTEEDTDYIYTRSDHAGGMTEVTEDEYNAVYDELCLEELSGGDVDFDAYLDVPEDKLPEISERIGELSFISSCDVRDLDEDGKNELAFDTTVIEEASGAITPSGINCVYYECGNEGRTNYGLIIFNKELSFVLDPNSKTCQLSAYERSEEDHSSELSEKQMNEWPSGKWICEEHDPYNVYFLYDDGTFTHTSSDGYSAEGIWYINYDLNSVELETYYKDYGSYTYYRSFGIEGDRLAAYPGKTTIYYDRVV